METRARYILIGLFSIFVMFGAFGFTLWLLRYDESSVNDTYDIVFTGAITGLGPGASVLFNGIKVGAVTDIAFDPIDSSKVTTRVQVRADTPVREDTRVFLEYQGLTGVAQIQMKGGTLDSPLFEPNEDGTPNRLAGEPSAVDDLVEGAREILNNANALVRRLDETLSEGQTSVLRSVENLEVFSGTLADSSGDINKLIANVAQASEEIGRVSATLDSVLGENRAVLQSSVANLNSVLENLASSSNRIETITQSVDVFTTALSDNTGRIGTFFDAATSAAEEARSAMVTVNTLVAANQVGVSTILANAEDFTGTLARNGEAIDSLITNASRASEQIADAAESVEGLLGRNSDTIDTTLSNVETVTSTIAENKETISSTLSSVGSAATRLESMATGLDEVVTTNRSNIDATLGNLATFSDILAKNSADIDIVISSINEAANSISEAGDSIEEVFGDNREKINNTLVSVEAFSRALGDSSDQVATLLSDVGSAARRIDDVSLRVDSLITENQTPISTTIRNFEAFSQTLSDNRQSIEMFLTDARTVAADLSGVGSNLNAILADNRDSLKRTLDGSAILAESLADNADDISSFLSDAGGVAARLLEVSNRIDGLVARADSLVEVEGSAFFKEAVAAAESVRRTATTLESEISQVTNGIGRLTDRGADELITLLRESRQAVARLDRIFANIERNPAQFVIGGEQVPQYRPGRR